MFKRNVSVLLAFVMLAVLFLALPSKQAHASDAYDDLRAKRKEMLTGGTSYSTSDPDIAAQITTITTRAQLYWDTMTTPPVSYVWSDLASRWETVQVTSSYNRLYAMALAYSTYGSSLYNNASLKTAIIAGLDWLYTNRYNETKTEDDKWWDWEIGIPNALNDTVILLYDQLTSTQITNYMNAVYHFSSDPTKMMGTATSSGANRVWKSRVVGLRGIIIKDSDTITAAKNALSPVFDYVTSSDGFYRDGSFIQHAYFSYNGGYGLSLIDDIANLLYLLDGSTWEITDPDVANVYKWVYDSFEPFVYKGSLMALTRGREMSRDYSTDHGKGAAIGQAITRLSTFAPTADAMAFQQMVKYWIQSDTYRSFYTNCPIPIIVLAKSIMNNSAVTPRGELIAHKQFYSMDRAVHLRPGFGFALSMSSSRIGTYESLSNNIENKKGWYTGDGMTYVYDSDLSQFDDNFWPTVNPYRLPGTTVDTMTRANNSGASYRNSSARAGGADIAGLYGVSGMSLYGWNSSLTALKSWFMFDDEVVALGAGITDSSQTGNGWDGIARKVETIVENRKLNSAGSNTLTVNGVDETATSSWTQSGVNWAHLAGNGSGSDVGYYFPGGATVKGLREARTGNWNAINENGSTTNATRSYQALWFDHGTNPTNQAYTYALLPGKTSAQMSSYASIPDIDVLENSTSAQAVKEKTINVIGANFWEDALKWIQVGGTNLISSNKKASVMTKETTDDFEVAVSDPTRLNTGNIAIEINRSAASIFSVDAGVNVTQLSPTIKLSVNVNNAKGKTFHAKFSFIPTPSVLLMDEDFDTGTTGSAPAGWTVDSPTGASTTIAAVPSASDKSMKLADSSTTTFTYAKKSFVAQTGETTFEFQAMAAQTSSTTGFHVRNTSGTSAITVAFGSSGDLYTYYGATQTNLQTYTANTWYTFKIVARPATDTFDLYINGTQVVANQSFRNAVTSVSEVYLNSPIALTGTFYYDEIQVYH
ncbi:polysaccharide lyase 8 family protein [Paenibacillus oryzisoli]|uniref:polysaccharide lyase 8 family protein n=1 Tax=Paenibacillus oryzisoli TaxID=1850517 RepID=UPI003D27F2BD